MQEELKILSTREVDEKIIEYCAANEVQLHAFNFIDTAPILDVETQQEIEVALQLNAVVVFTSMNAVEAVATFLDEDELPFWKIYCIGHTTRQLVEHYFGKDKITGTAANAMELAAKIIEQEDAMQDVVFFTGTKRRDDLPNALSNHSYNLQEIFVYETLTIARKVEETYHGIIFFSPSAVKSYFINNKAHYETIFFAIGNTTEAELQNYTENKIVVADASGKQNLIEQAVDYFKK